METASRPLKGIHILSMATNIPGPVALAHLTALGASAVKVEPPGGDLLAVAAPSWYGELHQNIRTISPDLKQPADRATFDSMLEESDLLLTASRLGALDRLGLGWSNLSKRFPGLLQVAITGYSDPDDERPGHDLTYQATTGLLKIPLLPRALIADLAGAERAIIAALSLILCRERTVRKSDKTGDRSVDPDQRIAHVSLAEAASAFARPLRHGLTAETGILGGSLPGYNLYQAKQGWVAVAALEPHFLQNLARALEIDDVTKEELTKVFLERTNKDWENWALKYDLPIVEVKDN
jgi:crotonobetainyl-CoA:carnitine CoA-transferase CaiB-like acyl-CoA transferase